MNKEHLISTASLAALALALPACSITIENNVVEEEYTVQKMSGEEFWDALAKEGIDKDRIYPDNLGMTEDSAFVSEGDLMLLLHGSSSCPPTPEVRDVDGVGENGITILELAYVDHGNVACTDDYGQHFFHLDFNDEDVAQDTTVSIVSGHDDKVVEKFIPVFLPEEEEEEV